MEVYIDALMQDCSDSIANALELLQSSTKLSICNYPLNAHRNTSTKNDAIRIESVKTTFI